MSILSLNNKPIWRHDVEGEFDLNTLRVDGEIFESGKTKLWIQKYPDTCGRGLSNQTLDSPRRKKKYLRRNPREVRVTSGQKCLHRIANFCAPVLNIVSQKI